MQTTAQPTMAMIPLSQIIPSESNPRKYFSEADMAELIASIRTNGILQPILVRNTGEGSYTIVAGERRFHAAMEVYGDEGSIPALIRELTDEGAETASLVENTARAAMSLTEEASAAKKLLDSLSGNRVEAAARLGWPLSKLNRRIGLLNLIPEAMDALTQQIILVGHAELLAAIPQDKQQKALDTVITHKVPVHKMKEMLLNVSTDFKDAIFCTSGCDACQHNSSLQASLFVDAIAEGRCTNQDCYTTKTQAKIEEIRSELTEEVQTVKIIEVGDNAYSALSVSGPMGVGEEQYTACKGCQSFGATVSNLPGSVGKVERSICFDAACLQLKVSARIKAEQSEPAAAKTAAPAHSKEKKAGAAGSANKSGAPKTAGLSQRVKDYRRKAWDIAIKKELAIQVGKASLFLMDLLLTGSARFVAESKLTAIFGKLSGLEYPRGINGAGNIDLTANLTIDQLDKLYTAAAVCAVEGIDESRLMKLISFLEADLGKHWQIDGEFLGLLTKSELEAVCSSVGLDALVPDFKKLLGGKKDQLVEAVLAASIQVVGSTPDILKY